MFKELHPLIQNRALTITVATIGDGKIRVNVVPHTIDADNKANEKVGYSHKDKVAQIPESAIAALTTPLSLIGTPEEIDGELTTALEQYAESHFQLQKTLEDAKEQIASAVKEIQEREKAKPKSSPSGAKHEEKRDKPAADNELLPLWVKPLHEPATPAAPNTAPVAAFQQTLNTEITEEVTR